MIKSHEIKNVMDFNVADSVRYDVKVLVTKTRYTVYAAKYYISNQKSNAISDMSFMNEV